VPEDFKMWVPVLLDFGRDQYAVLRLWVDKPHNKYKLPRAPLGAARGDFKSVSCGAMRGEEEIVILHSRLYLRIHA